MLWDENFVGFYEIENWLDKTKEIPHQCGSLSKWGEKNKTVNSKGKCHQMSELELLQNKAECFARDKNCCTKLVELYKSNSWKRDTSIGCNVNINKQSQIELPH